MSFGLPAAHGFAGVGGRGDGDNGCDQGQDDFDGVESHCRKKPVLTEWFHIWVIRTWISSSIFSHAESDGHKDQEGKAEAGGDDRHHHEGNDPSGEQMSCCQTTDDAAETEEDPAPYAGAAQLDPAITTNGTEEDNVRDDGAEAADDLNNGQNVDCSGWKRFLEMIVVRSHHRVLDQQVDGRRRWGSNSCWSHVLRRLRIHDEDERMKNRSVKAPFLSSSSTSC